MPLPIKLFGLSIVSMTIGAAFLGLGLGGGIYGFLGAPFLMVFGWFYFPVIVILHFVAWAMWPFFARQKRGKLIFILLGSCLAALLFSAIGIKVVDKVSLCALVYAISSFVTAFFSCIVITSWSANRDKISAKEQP